MEHCSEYNTLSSTLCMGLCNCDEYTAAVDFLALLLTLQNCSEVNAKESTAAVYPCVVTSMLMETQGVKFTCWRSLVEPISVISYLSRRDRRSLLTQGGAPLSSLALVTWA